MDRIFIRGTFPKETLSERLKALFHPKPKVFYFTIVDYKDFVSVENLKGIAMVNAKKEEGR